VNIAAVIDMSHAMEAFYLASAFWLRFVVHHGSTAGAMYDMYHRELEIL